MLRRFAPIHLLLNLAEDDKIERKMCRRGIIPLLVGFLDRPNRELLLLILSFLRCVAYDVCISASQRSDRNHGSKLSLFEEHKDRMAKEDVVGRLAAYVPCSDPLLLLVRSQSTAVRNVELTSGFAVGAAACLQSHV